MRVDPVPIMPPISLTTCFEQAVVPPAPPPLLFLSPVVAGGGNLTCDDRNRSVDRVPFQSASPNILLLRGIRLTPWPPFAGRAL
jgi:hypothetical protein